MRIAVIGTGVAGLTSAHLLRRDHDLVVYEGDTRPGGHANTIRVTDRAGTEHWVDTGFIVLNERNYPNFEDLLSELGVETRPSAMGLVDFGARRVVRVRGHGARALRPAARTSCGPRFLRMLRDQLRFNRDARQTIGRTRRAVGRRVRARHGLLGLVHGADRHARGLGGVVVRSRRGLGLPDLVPRRVPGEPRPARAARAAAVANRRRRLAHVCERDRRRARRLASPERARAPGRAPGRRRGRGRGRRVRDRVLRRGRDRRALRPGARDDRRPDRRPSARCWARCATSETRPRSTPMRR